MRRTIPLLLVLLLALSVPAAAYTVYLVDGSKIYAQEKYRIDGDKAIITLPSGTQTFIDADQIDVDRTERENQIDYGTALVIEGGEARVLVRNESGRGAAQERSLADVIAERRRGDTERQPAQPEASQEGDAELPRTEAGWPDLTALTRSPYPDPEVAQALSELLVGQGIDAPQVHAGTQPRHPFVEIEAATETGVFRALAVTANALLQLRDSYDRQVDAVELLVMADHQERAAQFTLTPELARELLTGQVDPATFFVEHVQF
jgi:hypothetical protein